ncbi:MAG: hypothetical protein KJZ80_11655 [Hyphomicrobiaceae bacterium]|nr:hypothetical protein [Hyphomicrobiaceae bacterium]
MERAELPYYAGLLSAAQYHGAAHHRPQEFQVVVAKARRPTSCGKVRVAFIARKNLPEVPFSPSTRQGARYGSPLPRPLPLIWWDTSIMSVG